MRTTWTKAFLGHSFIALTVMSSVFLAACAEPPVSTSPTALAEVELKSEDGLLAEGTKAPAFDLKATGNRQVSLASLKGKNIVLVFYPMDNTSGCTIQLCRLRDGLSQFEAHNTQVLASNPGSLDSHEDFAEKQHYTFPIMVDTENRMANAYKVASPVMNTRTVYVIDTTGVIRYAKRGMPLNDELLAVIGQINNSKRGKATSSARPSEASTPASEPSSKE